MVTVDTPRWVTVRFPRELADLLDQVCRAREEPRSAFVRRSVKRSLAELSYFDEAAKKALGVDSD
jgi:predicted transcriptional regulator